MVCEPTPRDIKILYKNKIVFTLFDVKSWDFTKRIIYKNYLLGFKNIKNDFVLECVVKNKDKVNKTIEMGYINLDDIDIIYT